jgi:hypothetical protein
LGIGEQGPVDDVGESPLESSQCFGLGLVVLGHASLEVRAGVVVAAHLRDRDAVDGCVDLAVACACEPVPLAVAGPHRQRGGAVVTCVGVLALESADVGGLSDDLGRGERANPHEGEQCRGELGDELGDVAFERSLADGEVAGVLDDLCGDAGDRTVESIQPDRDGVEVLQRGERSRWRIPGRVEFVEVPAEAVDTTGPLRDQVFAVIDQQAQLTSRAIELGDGEIWVPQRSVGHRERVDRVGLAVGARSIPSMGHQLRWDPHDPFASGEHVGLETP